MITPFNLKTSMRASETLSPKDTPSAVQRVAQDVFRWKTELQAALKWTLDWQKNGGPFTKLSEEADRLRQLIKILW